MIVSKHAICVQAIRMLCSGSAFGLLQNLLGVILGGVIGHFLCTGLAVLGGRVIAQKLSVRTGNAYVYVTVSVTMMVFRKVLYVGTTCYLLLWNELIGKRLGL